MTSTVPKPTTRVDTRRAEARIAELDAELRERDAQLALLSEVGEALKGQLDFDAISELVGQRLHDAFKGVPLFVALYDANSGMISFPYEVNSDGSRYHTEPIAAGTGLTGRVIKTRRPLSLSTLEEMQDAGAVDIGGEVSRSWLGVPMLAEDEVIGVVALESRVESAFSTADVQLVSTLAGTAGIALHNARLFAETTQRNAELAVINEIGEALAKQLDFQGIIDAVGDRIMRIFGVDSGAIALYDPQLQMFSIPYAVDQNERFTLDPVPISGLSKSVIQTKRPLRVGNVEEATALGATFFGVEGETAQSWVGVPIMAGDRVLGVTSIARMPKDAFSKSDERLLATIASNLGVALENARLFDETKHLLGETEQRNAELAVINEIGEALAKQLDFQGIIDAVGDKVGEVLRSQDLFIAMFDERTGAITFPYWIEDGARMYDIPALQLGQGLTSHVLKTRKPLRLGTWEDQQALGAVRMGEIEASWLGVPIASGDRVIGTLVIQRRELHAFSAADEQLVSTIASSMGVALENARLFGETKHLLGETEQRNAELAVINEIGEALAKQLDFQGIIDAVGDRITRIFGVDSGAISLLDPDTQLLTMPFAVDQGQRFTTGASAA